jgi:hypothetical protein
MCRFMGWRCSGGERGAATPASTITAQYAGLPGIGAHFISAIEAVNAGTQTFYGDVGNASLFQSGLIVRLRA